MKERNRGMLTAAAGDSSTSCVGRRRVAVVASLSVGGGVCLVSAYFGLGWLASISKLSERVVGWLLRYA